MTPRQGFEPHLAAEGVTVTARDVEMLRAIAEHGSMHRAADALGRSYPHLQRRVVELEDALGTITRRRRGGSDGGGTELTTTAEALIREFARLRSALAGVTAVSESVIDGRVIARDGELGTVRTPAGDLSARVPPDADRVELALRADAIVLMRPSSPTREHTSLRNQLEGSVSAIERRDGVAIVTVTVGDGVDLEAMVTAESVRRLGLDPGRPVVAAFKSTAARPTPVRR